MGLIEVDSVQPGDWAVRVPRSTERPRHRAIGNPRSNAYLYSSGPYSLRLRDAGRSRVRLSVRDTDPHIPAPFRWGAATPEELAERGRGLYLVTLYAESWGAYPMRGGLPGQGGKLLWAECAAKA
ncbi:MULTISPECIES: ATP-binding protein [unclassified Streptomyces]|uniref:ATP-binding protein n=1 Tax=unclassified Streptomyces TaxID=2593676 RepID=UPI00381C18AD